MTAASSSVASTYSADTETQQPQGTVMVADVLMCHTSSTAAGVTIATLSGTATPLIVIARAIGVTAPPVGMDTFACKSTSYRANLFVLPPAKVTTPVARGTTQPLLHGIDTTSNGTGLLRATFWSLEVRYFAIAVTSVHKTVTAAVAAGVAAAGKDRRPAIDGRRGDGACVQPVVQLIDLIGEALRDEGVLRGLRSRKLGHVELLTEVSRLTLGAVQFESAQLVEDSLGAARLAVDDVAGVGSRRRASGARLGCLSIAEVSDAAVDAGKALRVRRLLGEGAVQRSDLVVVELVADCGLRPADGGVHTVEAVAQAVLQRRCAVGNAHLRLAAAVTELRRQRGKTVTNGSDAVVELRVTEAVRDVVVDALLAVEQPREIDTEAHHAAHTAKAAHAPAVPANQEQKNHKFVIAKAFYPLLLSLLIRDSSAYLFNCFPSPTSPYIRNSVRTDIKHFRKFFSGHLRVRFDE